MTRPSAFAPLIAASDVEAALLTQLRRWLPDYLAEVDRQHDREVGTLPAPRGWVISSDVEKMPEDQTPTIIIASPGLTDPPLADGNGKYTARWRVTVAVHLSARGNALALTLAREYVLALRALLLQQQNLDRLAVRRIDWEDERYDMLPPIDDRTVCTGEVELAVEVADVTTRHAGPLAPILPPGDLEPDSPSWPTAETAGVDVDKWPLSPDPDPDPGPHIVGSFDRAFADEFT